MRNQAGVTWGIIAFCLVGALAWASGSRAVEISLKVETPSQDQLLPHAVLPGENLRAGDRLALRVAVNRPAYVYAVYAEPEGKPALLYPKVSDAKDRMLQASRPLRIPEKDWLHLSQRRGPGRLLLLASPHTLSLNEVLQLAARSPPKPPKDPPRPKKCDPDVKDECTRAPDGWVHAAAAGTGVATIDFLIEQR